MEQQQEDGFDACCGCLCCEKNFGPCLGKGGLAGWKRFEHRFWQHEMYEFNFYVYPKHLLLMYAVMFVTLTALGVVVIVGETQVVTTDRVRYDNIEQCDVGGVFTEVKNCTVTLTLNEPVTSPTVFYYGLRFFFQGVRTYKTSFSVQQLRGEFPAPDGYEDMCDPRITSGPTPPPEPFATQEPDILLPCGVLPWSVFNDTLALFKDSELTDPVSVSQTGLTRDYEVDDLYLPGPSDGGYTTAVNDFITSVNFISWMRTSTFPTLQKALYRIEEDLAAGTYYVQIGSAFPVSEFDGEKFIFMQQLNYLDAGSNLYLAIVLFVIGGLSLLMVVWITFALLVDKRRNRYEEAPMEVSTEVPMEAQSEASS
eukprot:CAMPEP_0184739358 /NCGR_PEP_ID=MMETSP0315-20130426/2207_1 /TAXON_ID=101924 /ORGANISM="Rhodosorus marinus, Strain UTEX LB 2760" /LENGTH=366 /DNA_ID=CAMNT_0027208053 /DNA_START=74 /DNA_END=1174 /DNA_ORIENTATION=+